MKNNGLHNVDVMAGHADQMSTHSHRFYFSFHLLSSLSHFNLVLGKEYVMNEYLKERNF